MLFRTEVELPPSPLRLTPRSRALLVGSCFTDHVGTYLADRLPEGHVMVNPLGTLYNPASLLTTLRWLMSPTCELSDGLAFVGRDGLWHHWLCSTLFAAPTREALLSELHDVWQRGHALLTQTDALFITFSSDRAYILNDGPQAGTVVANCHKEPAKLFVTEQVCTAGLQAQWIDLLDRLGEINQRLQVILTLSPYRYAKYGLHESQLGKARLLLLCEALQQARPGRISYFPAYEIVTDELRDYRFYAPDMIHPSDQAAAYVCERLEAWTFTPEMSEYARERMALVRDLRHHLVNPESEASRRFIERREERRQAFARKWGEEIGEAGR